LTPPLPHPLGLTADQFRTAYPRIVPGGDVSVLRRYSGIFRRGDLAGLESHAIGEVNRVHTSESDEGTVLKFTQWVAGRKPEERLETESVLIPMIGKRRVRAYTLCVSSQVGCAMGCGFCQTAQMGLVRSLEAWEIVQQWFAARWLVQRPDPEAEIRNIVFMGMGEPMDNLEAVVQSIAVLTDSRGPALASSRVTVSTVGRIDGITKFAEYVEKPGNHRIGLAISLNASNDAVRSQIMPVNRAMPLAKLRDALLRWPFYAGKHLCLEYVLIPGVNDAVEHADELAQYVKGRDVQASTGSVFAEAEPLTGMVNVIPYNPREGSPWPAPSEETVDAFVARLTSHGVYTKRRRTKGRDQMAACGQLGNLAYRRKPVAVSISAK
jgi:23S rRNA (adenine2503-C2)-methyltransferase